MKQLLQDARTGDLTVTEVPAPQLLPGCVLVRTAASLVSAGTERASAEFAKKNLLAKAKARPDLVRDVLAKFQRDGLSATLGTVRSRLDQPQSVGYSSAGTVIAVGDGVADIAPGDRVACAGANYAVHAEFACIPRLLLARIPAPALAPNSEALPVYFEEAAFGTVGAICLHGIRTAEAALGETIAVIGLGLLGQITIQLLRIAGCRVLGMDLLQQRADLARQSGAEATATSASGFRDLCFQLSGGRGVDSVLITAETPSSDPVNVAAEVARDRAIVCAVGTVGLELQRKLYYEKELDFRISRSYGPGRYDTAYEQKGRDYPIGYVRWTETRNLEAFLQLLADRKLNLQSLITHRFPLDQSTRAYDLISGKSPEPYLAVMLTYPEAEITRSDAIRPIPVARISPSTSTLGIGVLGAGNFALNTLLPALQSLKNVSFQAVCNATGPRSHHAAEKFHFAYAADNEQQLLQDPKVNAVVIATRHHLHAAQTQAALRAGKHVFCEKPLCLSEAELSEIIRTAAAGSAPLLMVGFNRRFAPMAIELKAFLNEIHEPLAIHYRINAGLIPADHWVNDPEQGGGRILGEVCHFVDFLCFLANSNPIQVQALAVGNPGQYSQDNIVATLKFANGALGTISYLANGDKSASKERVEVFGGQSVAVLEDFRHLELVRHGRKQITKARAGQDKGHKAEMQAFVKSVQGQAEPPIPFEQILASTLATLRLQDSCQLGEPLPIEVNEFISSAIKNSGQTEN
jgi:predicted dehydrogenase/threonine dehydrogenase-like Zn-dependent dehydrogenase